MYRCIYDEFKFFLEIPILILNFQCKLVVCLYSLDIESGRIVEWFHFLFFSGMGSTLNEIGGLAFSYRILSKSLITFKIKMGKKENVDSSVSHSRFIRENVYLCAFTFE